MAATDPLNPHRALAILATEVSLVLNSIDDDDEREREHEAFEGIVNDELYAGSLNRRLSVSAVALAARVMNGRGADRAMAVRNESVELRGLR